MAAVRILELVKVSGLALKDHRACAEAEDHSRGN